MTYFQNYHVDNNPLGPWAYSFLFLLGGLGASGSQIEVVILTGICIFNHNLYSGRILLYIF